MRRSSSAGETAQLLSGADEVRRRQGPSTGALTIRDARDPDAPSIAPLLEELGYPVSAQEVAERLASVGRDTVLVAESADGVVGVVSVSFNRPLHRTKLVARVTVLVVRSDWRGRGVGRKLMAQAERVAIGRGAGHLELTSNTDRTAAHRFYEHLGYRIVGVKLVRELS
jgi:GNAT superfamily N-acetyltransferase